MQEKDSKLILFALRKKTKLQLIFQGIEKYLLRYMTLYVKEGPLTINFKLCAKTYAYHFQKTEYS